MVGLQRRYATCNKLTKKDKYCMISFFMESFKKTNETVTKPRLKDAKNRLVITRGKAIWMWKICVGCECVRVCVCLLSCIQLFVTLCTVACQAPLCTEFLGKNTGQGCHFLLNGWIKEVKIKDKNI